MKSEINSLLYPKPLIFNCYKPKGISSFDVVRHFKRNLPKGYGKIGHFGTLDPFACGVLMIGVAGAAKVNNYIHDCLSKTYIASGILGQESLTGDTTEGITNTDNSSYLHEVIAKFDKDFIEQNLREKFLGKYLQSPHIFSAAKYEGRKLHEWARDGVNIIKDKKERDVLQINVLEYNFPYLKIEFEVSSGTYIRTLFSDCARYLGTLGVLDNLERTVVGGCNLSNAIHQSNWPNTGRFDLNNNSIDLRDMLGFSKITFAPKEENLFLNGVRLKRGRQSADTAGVLSKAFNNYFWVENEAHKLLGLVKEEDEHFKAQFILSSSSE